MIVVDASLAVKWLLPEADRKAAIRFLRRYRGALVAPDLIAIEVASAIIRRANIDKSLTDYALDALRRWTTAPLSDLVRRFPVTPRRLSGAGRLAVRLGHPIADCIYLALAIEMDCDLATSDTRFVGKATALWPRVHLLADYSAA